MIVKSNLNLANIEEYRPSNRGNDQIAKLDWNECNLPLDPQFGDILKAAITDINFTEYPDISHDKLLHSLALYCNVSPKQIQIFNGSDSALNYIFSAFLNPDTRVLIYYPHYSQVETYIKVHAKNINYSDIKNVFAEHEYDLSAIKDNDIIYLTNPNNPTGHVLDVSIIETQLALYPDKLFIIDEAYYEFCGVSSATLVPKYANIIVTRTFSKAFSLASARLGYICCNEELIKTIDKIRNTKEVNSFAQKLGQAALDNYSFIDQRVKLVNENMQVFKTRLRNMNIEFVDSRANFVLIRIENVGQLIKSLKEQHILVRDRSMFRGLKNCVRITIGTKVEMDTIANVINVHLNQLSQ